MTQITAWKCPAAKWSSSDQQNGDLALMAGGFGVSGPEAVVCWWLSFLWTLWGESSPESGWLGTPWGQEVHLCPLQVPPPQRREEKISGDIATRQSWMV